MIGRVFMMQLMQLWDSGIWRNWTNESLLRSFEEKEALMLKYAIDDQKFADLMSRQMSEISTVLRERAMSLGLSTRGEHR